MQHLAPARVASSETAEPTVTRFQALREESEAGRPALLLDDLIYPHRYDILARLDFLAFYEERRELYRKDFREFLRQSAETQYGSYLLRVRLEWKLHRNPGPAWLRGWRKQRYFRAQVTQFVRVFESIRLDGFRAQWPIWVYLPDGPVVTNAGRRFHRPALLHNGCHRVSALKRLGHISLPAAHWQQRTRRPKAVPDCTAECLSHGGVTAADHWRFLQPYYGIPGVSGLEELFERWRPLLEGGELGDPPADRLLELVRGLPVDWQAMGAPIPEWFAPWQRWAEAVGTAWEARHG